MPSIFDDWVCEHAEYGRARASLVRQIDDVVDGGRAFAFTLLGQSSSGKSELIKDVAKKYEGVTNADLQPLVLAVSVPVDAPDLYGVHSAVMQRVIGPIMMDRRSSGTKAKGALVRSGARVLIVDEVNHLIEKHTSRTAQTKGNRSFADWVKQLIEEDVSVGLVGLPHVERLLEDNEQLEERALRPIRMRPYRWTDSVERESYRKMVNEFLSRLHKHGWAVDLEPDSALPSTYLCTGGLVGRLARLLVEAEKMGKKDRRMSMNLLAAAFEVRFKDQWGNPFKMSQWPVELLMKAYAATERKADAPKHQEPRGRKSRSTQ
jgi:hypothetical protein